MEVSKTFGGGREGMRSFLFFKIFTKIKEIEFVIYKIGDFFIKY